MPDLTYGPYGHLTFLLSQGGTPVEVDPSIADPKISREPGGEDTFYFRDKMPGALTFRGADYQLLLAIDQSADRCQDIYLHVEVRSYAGGPLVYTWLGTFTCSECEFNRALCLVKVTPTPADGYQVLFEAWDREVNLLATPAPRRTIFAQLSNLPEQQSIEFMLTNTDAQGDFIGVDGWAVFLTNTSFIGGRTREKKVILFHYLLRNVPMELDEVGQYQARDLTNQGWQFYTRNDNVSPPTADYVKEPEISGFKPYKIGTFDDWWHTEGGRNPVYGTDLLLLDCGEQPSDYGFVDDGYVQVTGTGGAYNDECVLNGSYCLNMRRNLRNNNCKSLWWKFGQFSFTRCFPLLDGLYYVLGQTAPQLLPPRATDLSSFFYLPINPVTAATGVGNELPTLLLSDASDIKRYKASEDATRNLISLKQLVADLCTNWDLGYFIDNTTGWFRIEHRSFFEAQVNGMLLDLTSQGPYSSSAQTSETYSYRSEKLPKYEQLQITSAVTEDFTRGVSFSKGEIEYSGACVNNREGQNTATRTVSRLTGDVAGMVLSGDAISDKAIAVIAVNADGSLRDGNRALAASELLRRYHRHGRVRPTGKINGVDQRFASVRLVREEAGISATLCSLALIGPPTVVYTALSREARVAKAEISLATGVVTMSVLHPTLESATAGPLAQGRQFNRSFDESAR